MFRDARRYLTILLGLGLVAVIATGCVIQDPPALNDISQARSAIDSAKEAGTKDRFPDDFAELEKRYLQTRGTFYACQDAKASEMALALATDAQALATRPLAVPPPPNQAPQASMILPAGDAEVDSPALFQSTGSVDPDGGPLTYQWSFGDGGASTLENPTHAYTAPGNYPVKLTVADAQGETATVTQTISVVRRVVLQQTKRERVQFELNQAVLSLGAQQALALVIGEMEANDKLRTEITGHTDSAGPEDYNMQLSQRRAEAVRDYLVEQGIPAEHLMLDWQGEAQPVAPNNTKEGRAQNRRVELTVRPPDAQ